MMYALWNPTISSYITARPAIPFSHYQSGAVAQYIPDKFSDNVELAKLFHTKQGAVKFGKQWLRDRKKDARQPPWEWELRIVPVKLSAGRCEEYVV
jgi:hypothetical protein